MVLAGFSIEFCKAIAVLLRGVTRGMLLELIYWSKPFPLTTVTLTCDTHDKCYWFNWGPCLGAPPSLADIGDDDDVKNMMLI